MADSSCALPPLWERITARGFGPGSKSEFAAKLNLGLMELEESLYWMELLEGSRPCDGTSLDWLNKEVGELTAIHVACIKKARL